jgi:hypothetical protein
LRVKREFQFILVDAFAEALEMINTVELKANFGIIFPDKSI